MCWQVQRLNSSLVPARWRTGLRKTGSSSAVLDTAPESSAATAGSGGVARSASSSWIMDPVPVSSTASSQHILLPSPSLAWCAAAINPIIVAAWWPVLTDRGQTRVTRVTRVENSFVAILQMVLNKHTDCFSRSLW